VLLLTRAALPLDPFFTQFIEARLDAVTAELAQGCSVACLFVNDNCDAEVRRLSKALLLEGGSNGGRPVSTRFLEAASHRLGMQLVTLLASLWGTMACDA
jgi:hypothetical protein